MTNTSWEDVNHGVLGARAEGQKITLTSSGAFQNIVSAQIDLQPAQEPTALPAFERAHPDEHIIRGDE